MTGQNDHLRGLIDLYPDDARAQLRLGESYAALGDHAKALDCYKAASELDAQLSPIYRRQSDGYRALGRYRQAEGPLAKFVAMHPSVANPHGLFAELMMKMGRFEESIASYEKALALDPDFRAARIGIGNNLIFLERPEDARKTFEKLHESASEDGERLTALSWLAAAHLHREDHEGALAQLEKAQALAGGIGDAVALADVLELMGDVLLETGSEDAARSRYAESAAAIEDSDLTDAVKHVARSNHIYHQARIAIARGEIGTAKAKLAAYRGSLGDGIPGAKDRFNEISGRVALAEGDRETAVRQFERANPARSPDRPHARPDLPRSGPRTGRTEAQPTRGGVQRAGNPICARPGQGTKVVGGDLRAYPGVMSESTNTLEKLAGRGARLVHSAFAAYLDEFRAITRVARVRFEARDWQSQACDSLDRLDLYSRSVTDAAARLRGLLGNLDLESRVVDRDQERFPSLRRRSESRAGQDVLQLAHEKDFLHGRRRSPDRVCVVGPRDSGLEP